jgi:predicted GNAT family N-acyltransferase
MVIQPIQSEQTRSLRHLVLWPHLPDALQCVTDVDDKPETFHLGAFDQGRLLAVGTFFPQTTVKVKARNPYRLRAMASHPEARGSGAALALIQQALHLLTTMNADVLWCDARLGAVGFYEKAGFSYLPQVYDVPRIGPHRFMWIHLSAMATE